MQKIMKWVRDLDPGEISIIVVVIIGYIVGVIGGLTGIGLGIALVAGPFEFEDGNLSGGVFMGGIALLFGARKLNSKGEKLEEPDSPTADTLKLE